MTLRAGWRLITTGLLLLAFVRGAPAAGAALIDLAYLSLAAPRSFPLTYLDQPPADEGLQGARLALADNNTTGSFTGQQFRLAETVVPPGGDVKAAFRQLVASGHRLFVTDLPADQLLAVADLPEARDVLLIDAADKDDRLRGADCRRNTLHVMPSYAMLADALVQYFVYKRWANMLLVVGPAPADKDYAEALRRSARKFGVRIAADKPWTYDPGARRTDTGHYQIEAEVARFTQGLSYDMLVVSDEGDEFGDELGYRQTLPRPVAGTQGLVSAAWARPFEQWGATQLQNRFLRRAHRWMTERDFGAWMGVRAYGEAATHGNTADPRGIIDFMRGPRFEMAAFKGARLTFRDWDGQLRQPVLLADDRSLVSVSPQPGFLHQYSELDTLGVDRPETKCAMK